MKKLFLTLMCVIAAAIPALADVTYELVTDISTLSATDNVVLLVSKNISAGYVAASSTIEEQNGNTYFGKVDLPTNAQGAPDSFTLNDDIANELLVVNLVYSDADKKYTLRKAGTDQYIAAGGVNQMKLADVGTGFTMAANGKGFTMTIQSRAYFAFTNQGYFTRGSTNNAPALYKIVDGGTVKESLYLALSTSQVKIQMEEGKTVTGKLPEVTAYLNYYDNDKREKVTDVKYSYTIVQAEEGEGANTVVNDVITLDENGTINVLKAGDVYIKIELESDKYNAEPRFVNVIVSEPKVEYTGTVFTAGATSSFYLTLSGSTEHLFDLENGESKIYKLDGTGTYGKTYYVYPAANRDVISVMVDGNPATVTEFDGQKIGYFTVYAGSEPKEIIVTTSEPVVVQTGTKFTITGGGGLQVWRRQGWEEYVFYNNLEPNAEGIAYLEIPSPVNGVTYTYLVSADANSYILSGEQNGRALSVYSHYDSDPYPGNYTILNGTYDVALNCVPKTAIEEVTFNLTNGSSVVIKDADNNVVQTLTYSSYSNSFKINLVKNKLYYIYAAAGYELSNVLNADNEPVKIDSSMGDPCVMFYSDESKSYTIAATKPAINVYFTDSREVTIYRYTQPRNALINFAEETDVNTFDLYSGLEGSLYLIGSNDGYEITSISSNPATKFTIFTSAQYPTFKVENNTKSLGTFAYLYVTRDITDLTVTVTKVVEPVKVEFEVAEGGRVVLMHQNGAQWVTDETFDASTGAIDREANLDQDTQYYLMADQGYKLTEVLDDNGEAMTIADCEEHMPYATNYVTFNSNDAPSMVSITAIENKEEIDPDLVKTGQMVTFDFCENTARLDLSQASFSSGAYNFTPGKTMIGDGGAVMLEFGGGRNAVYNPDKNLTISSRAGFNGANPVTGNMTVKFTDATSYLEKIVLEYEDGSLSFVTVSNGTLLGTVWEPSAPASAPSMNVVKAGNEVKSVTFTPPVATGSFEVKNVNIRKMMVTYAGPKLPTGIETVEASAEDVEAVYYNLQGVRVDNPAAGIYVRVRGNEVDKVLVK